MEKTPACTLRIENFGPIDTAELALGDVNVLVGPQATGKSLAMQCLKLLIDQEAIQRKMKDANLRWGGKDAGRVFADLYFGEGVGQRWDGDPAKPTTLSYGRRTIDLKALGRTPGVNTKRRQSHDRESVFLIPAQRVLVMERGWPSRFIDFSPGDPFVVRDFSESLRNLLDDERFGEQRIFPQQGRLKKEFRDLLSDNIFRGFNLNIDRSRPERRFSLSAEGGAGLPYMAWSAGQREFTPLLLGLYRLMPPTKVSRRGQLKWVVIEEPEMGLHPKAINAVLLMILDLVRRGYRVCLSTHSMQVVELVWAINELQRAKAGPDYILDLFKVTKKTDPMLEIAKNTLQRICKVFYFKTQGPAGQGSSVEDLSTLSLEGDGSWGGLLDFSAAVNDTVARVIANRQEQA